MQCNIASLLGSLICRMWPGNKATLQSSYQGVGLAMRTHAVAYSAQLPRHTSHCDMMLLHKASKCSMQYMWKAYLEGYSDLVHREGLYN